MSRKKNITVVASSIALGALLATGVSGVAMAANGDNSSASPSASSSASPDSGQHGKHGLSGNAQGDNKGQHGKGRGGDHAGMGIGRGRALHSTATIKDSTGAFVNLASIQGSITAVSATSITVKAADDFTATYVINASTKVHTDAKKNSTIADVAIGQTAEVRGTSTGSTLTADHVHVQSASSSNSQ